MLAGQSAHDYLVARSRNCTLDPRSVSQFSNNNLEILEICLAAPQQRDPCTELHDLAAIDAWLERVCAAWSSFHEHVILAILSLVESAGVVEAGSPPSIPLRLPHRSSGKPPSVSVESGPRSCVDLPITCLNRPRPS
jgi:hypothetical protein